MNRDKKIKREVDRTMRSLDGIGRAETDPFFYARLEERLRDREEPPESAPILGMVTLRTAAAAAAVILLVVINVFTVLEYEKSYEDTEASREENLEAFVEEYELQIPTIYELNSEE